MLEIRTFHSQILEQDLHQMLNKNRYLQRPNGDLKSHLSTQVLHLMTSIFGRHWYDNILCSEVAFAATLLRSTVYEWYLGYRKRNGNRPPRDLPTFQEALLNRFGSNIRG